MNFVRMVVLGCTLGLGLAAPRADAQVGAASSSATTGPRGLPRPSGTELPAADPVSVAELDAWLARLTGADAAARKSALSSFEPGHAAMVPAISRRLADLKKSANRDGMASLLAKVRQGAGKEQDEERPSPKAPAPAASSAGTSGDWLDRAMSMPRPQDAAWRDSVAILGLSRMLVRIGSTSAGRELVGMYASLGELFRIDLERQIKQLGERVVPALIEARRADSKGLRAWASKELDTLGKTVPGEAVQTADSQVLADVLRAYGRTRDVDAARVIVSFANSDRTLVRDAAREAVVLLGDSGLWQLRESYESLVGGKAPDDWGWERTASELFAAYDRSRLAEVQKLMDEGLAAQKAGRLEDMARAFDKVLARAPMFERRAEMVGGYLDLAKSLQGADRARALALLRKASRIDPAGPRAREVTSELVLQEAEDLASRGVLDEAWYAHAVELDPANAAAQAALARIRSESDLRAAALRRYAAVVALGLAAVLAGVAAFARRRTGTRAKQT